MAEPITTQKLINASLDSDTLGEFANEDKMVTSRLGAEYPSAPMASRLVVENGLLGATPFASAASMGASSLVDGDYAIVTDDSDLAKNGFWQKQSGVWNLLKWNPLQQSKEYANANPLFKPQRLEPTTDIDTLFTAGIYHVPNIDTATALGLPVAKVGQIYVSGNTKEDNTGYVFQTYINLDGSVFQRLYTGSIWYEWRGNDADSVVKIGEQPYKVVTNISELNGNIDNFFSAGSFFINNSGLTTTANGFPFGDSGGFLDVFVSESGYTYQKWSTINGQVIRYGSLRNGVPVWSDWSGFKNDNADVVDLANTKKAIVTYGSSTLAHLSDELQTFADNKGIDFYGHAVSGDTIAGTGMISGANKVTIRVPDGELIKDTYVPVVYTTSFGERGKNVDFRLENGVVGTLDVYNSRFRATSNASVSPSTVFNAEPLAKRPSNATYIINSGKNDVSATVDNTQYVIEKTDEIVNGLPFGAEFIVLGHFADTNSSVAETNHINIINSALKSKYGSRYLSINDILFDDATWLNLGLTKTAADRSAIAKGNLPPSLSRDSGHLSAAMDVVLANEVIRYSSALGVITAQMLTNTGIVFNESANTGVKQRINRAVKSIALRGNYTDKLITLAYFIYYNDVLTIYLASPDTLDEAMSGTTNTKFVAKYSGSPVFSGLQTLVLSETSNSGMDGEITIDFDELLQSDRLQSDYTAKHRLIDKSKIINLNASYNNIIKISQSAMFVTGVDVKNQKINAAVEEIAFFKPLPADKYLILAGLFYTTNSAVMHIYAADDKDSVGTLWEVGEGVIDENNSILFIFDQGYAFVNFNNYYPDNSEAALLADKATYSTRGINKQFIKTGLLKSGLITKPKTQMVETDSYHIPKSIREQAVKLYIKGDIADDDYYVLSTFVWSIVDSKYRLSFQIRKPTEPGATIDTAPVYYTGSVLFDTLADIKGVITIKANRILATFEADVVIDLTDLQYIKDYNKTHSPYILNPSGMTYANSGFDVKALRQASESYYQKSGGLTSYNTLNEALAFNESGFFAVGGNTFKSRVKNPVSKSDFICTNNPPKLLSKKPVQREYDFYYKGNKARLEFIDDNDTFYFLTDSHIFKSTTPLSQPLSAVSSSTDDDFIVYDVGAQTYHSIPDFNEVFTAASLSVPNFDFIRLTYDNELLIMSRNDNVRTIMFTQNNQSELRTFDFNGTVGDKYAFGAGVSIVKDWCMSHYKNIMFFSDYDNGLDDVGRGTTGGQKCHVSLDNGYTFTKCFDFTGNDWSNITNASNITDFNGVQAHIHAVTYDPKQDVVWIVTGDGAVANDNSSLFWSRDLGQTWTHMRSIISDNGQRSQMIMALPFDNCVAFGSDASNLTGTSVITYNNDDMVQEFAHDFADGANGLFSFARSTWSSQRHNVKYMSFGRNLRVDDATHSKSMVIMSSNGYNWDVAWQDKNAGIYGNVYCYDDSAGNLYVSLDGTSEYKNRVVVVDTTYD